MSHSHVEICVDDMCYSSSSRDGGVRYKAINLNSGNWEKICIDTKFKQRVYTFFERTKDAKYDYLTAFLNQILKLNKDICNGKWYCSEWVIEALNSANDLQLDTNMTMKEFYDWCKKRELTDYKEGGMSSDVHSEYEDEE